MQIDPSTWRKEEKTFLGIECSPGLSTGDLQLHANAGVIDICRQLGGQLLMTLDSHFVSPDKKFLQDILLKASGGGWHFYTAYAQFTMEQAWEKWKLRHHVLPTMASDFAEGVESNSDLISRIERFSIPTEYHLPPVDLPIEISSTQDTWDEKLENYVISLIAEYGRFPGRDHPDRPKYVDRLRAELDVITRNGTINFLPYFITLSEEICRPGRERGILFGPGRGSAAGSLLAYLLRVTHLDPIFWGLSFARFLSLGRIRRGKFPDIDLDMGDPEAVTQVLKDKFGECFARICTTNTLKPKNAIRDICRVLLDTQNDSAAAELVNNVSKSMGNVPQRMSNMHNWLYGWEDNEGAHMGECQVNPLLAKFLEDYPEVKRALDEILGIPRSLGRHASGYCLSDIPLSEVMPMCVIKEETCTQFTMSPVEELGFLKIDFLGLNTLNDIAGALKLIKERTGRDIDFYNIPDRDPETFANFQTGRNETVFQFKSEIAVGVCKQIQPVCINDLSDITAAGRPGTMYALMDDGKTTLIDAWVARRNKREEVRYIHPDMEEILHSTLGVIIYQEQIMALFQKCCGFSEERSDEIREIIGKKEADQMNRILPETRDTLQARGWTSIQIESFVSFLIAASQYSFNKSHSLSYAYAGYVCQYLKTHYPLEWWTSVLQNSNSDDVKATAQFCKEFVICPDINNSDLDFYIIDGVKEKIVYPLSMVRGVKGAGRDIASKRPFTSMEDFYARVDRRLSHRGVVMSLIWAGAFDRLGDATVPEDRNRIAVEYLKLRSQKEADAFVPVDKFNCLLKQNFALPLNAADFSGSLRELTGQRIVSVPDLATMGPGNIVLTAGAIQEVKAIVTKTGKNPGSPMAFITITDQSQIQDITVFTDLYMVHKARLKANEIVLVKVKIQSFRGKISLVAESLKFFGSIEEVPEEEPVVAPVAAPAVAVPTVQIPPVPIFHRVVRESEVEEYQES